jgi:hypothetical protein
MKKIFITLSLILVLILISTNLNAQPSQVPPYSISAFGGYSWLNGVLGGEAQFGHYAVGGGWMPTKMPMSGITINSGCFYGTYYTGTPLDEYSFYISAGMATAGYQYEDSWGGQETLPITIIMGGAKYTSGPIYLKTGIGYGWCSEMGSFTFEIGLGFTIFGN